MPSYAYNSSNELISTPATTYSYDNNGNTITKTDSSGTTTYGWDFDNRLVSVGLAGSGGTISFKYDPLGRRIQKSSLASTTNYLYNGNNTIAEMDGSGGFIVHYAQGDGFDEPLSELRRGVTVYYEADGLNSITSISSSTAALVNTYSYDLFGNITGSTGTLTNPFQYTARETDPETGLRYYRMRYYDPADGRFLSEDPLISDSRSLYAYTGNNPVNWIDPSGLYMSKAECWRLFQDIKHKATVLTKEIAKYNPIKDGMGGWQHAYGGTTTQGGHYYYEMTELVIGITGDSLRYWKECRDCDKGPKGPRLPEKFWEPVRRFNKLPKPVIPMTQYEMDQMELSYRYKERFWEDILIGDYLLGVFVTAGQTAPALGGAGGLVPAFAH